MAKKNKPLLYTLLAIVVLAFIFVSVPGISGNLFALTGNIKTQNLVVNPSFETVSGVTPVSWTFYNSDVNHQILSDSSTHAGSWGLRSLHFIVNNSNKLWFNTKGANISVGAGKTYLIEMWVKTKNLPAFTGNQTGPNYYDRFNLEWREYKSDGTQQTNYNGLTISPYTSLNGNWEQFRNKDWTKISTFYKMQAGTTSIIPALYFYTTNGELWVDEVRISELEDLPTQYIANPSFELWQYTYRDTRATNNSALDTALGWVCGQFGGICERSTTAQNGFYSYKVTATGMHSTYISQEANYIQIGRKYTVSAYVKSLDKVFLHTQRTNWTIGGDSGGIWYNGGDTWQKMSYDFIATKSLTHRIVFETMSNSPGTSFLVDNVEIKDNGVATACSVNSNCPASDVCVSSYCIPLVCVSGYHSENYVCVKDPVDCQAGYHWDTTAQSCVQNPEGFNPKMLYQIGLIIIAGVLILLIIRKK